MLGKNWGHYFTVHVYWKCSDRWTVSCVTHVVACCRKVPTFFHPVTTQTVTKGSSEFSFSLLYKRPLAFLRINNPLSLIPFTFSSRLCSNPFPPHPLHEQRYFIPWAEIGEDVPRLALDRAKAATSECLYHDFLLTFQAWSMWYNLLYYCFLNTLFASSRLSHYRNWISSGIYFALNF